MKVQVLFSLLPLLSGLSMAFPTAESNPIPAALPQDADIEATGPPPSNLTVTPPAVPGGDAEEADAAEDEGAIEDAESEPSMDVAKRAGQSMTWNQNFKFKHVKADATETFHRNGNVRFRSYFRNGGWPTYKYALTCGVRDKDGNVYTLTRKGRICGKARFWCSKKDSKDVTKYNAAVKNHWASIVAGPRKMHCRAQLKWDLGGLINGIIDILKKYGPIIKSVIAIF